MEGLVSTEPTPSSLCIAAFKPIIILCYDDILNKTEKFIGLIQSISRDVPLSVFLCLQPAHSPLILNGER